MKAEKLMILGFVRKNFCIYTSFKVGYTSLYSLVKENWLDHYTFDYQIPVNIQQKNKFAIIRDPFSRLESLYKDKFIFSIQHQIIQNCHKPIIDIFGKDYVMSGSVTFKDFIYNISGLIHTEPHFNPQNSFIPKNVNQFLDLHNTNDMLKLNEIIERELPIKNHTPQDMHLDWDSTMRNMVYNLYRVDFNRFYKDKIINNEYKTN